jgi:hypothetical protein
MLPFDNIGLDDQRFTLLKALQTRRQGQVRFLANAFRAKLLRQCSPGFGPTGTNLQARREPSEAMNRLWHQGLALRVATPLQQ